MTVWAPCACAEGDDGVNYIKIITKKKEKMTVFIPCASPEGDDGVKMK